MDEEKEELLPKFLKKTIFMRLVLQNKSFDQFINLSQGAVKMFVNMCEFKQYKQGEEVQMKSGGIVWRGKLKNDLVP